MNTRKPSRAITEDVKSFTSWKLDLQKCLFADPRLKPSHKTVATCILHHMNKTLGKPSSAMRRSPTKPVSVCGRSCERYST
jgi:hypothetical protein